MKFSSIISAEPALLRPDDAGAFLGSRQILDDAVRARWITPKVQRSRLTLYSMTQLRVVAARIEKGEIPPPEPRVIKAAPVPFVRNDIADATNLPESV